jgi:hypothetical protein
MRQLNLVEGDAGHTGVLAEIRRYPSTRIAADGDATARTYTVLGRTRDTFQVRRDVGAAGVRFAAHLAVPRKDDLVAVIVSYPSDPSLINRLAVAQARRMAAAG